MIAGNQPVDSPPLVLHTGLVPGFLHLFHAALVCLGVLALAVLLRPQRRPQRSRLAELRAAAADGSLIDMAHDRARAELSGTRPRVARSTQVARSSRRVAAAGCLVAAAIHAIVCPEHFREAAHLGLFFLGITALQLALAVLLLHDDARQWAAWCVVINTGTVALWAAVRTTALPFGLAAREPVGFPDVAATAAEVLAVAAAVAYLARRAAPIPHRAVAVGV